MVVGIIPDSIRRIVQREEPQYPTGDRSAQVISICAQKGGVGKTTTAVNLASALSMFHMQKVLLVDMDSQGHVAASLFNESHGHAGP